MSKHDIDNALTHPDLPLSDLVHGPYKMTPPEMLHTSGSGLIKYIFLTLKARLADKWRNIIDKLHRKVSKNILRQSDNDFPDGSVCNGIADGTKLQSTEARDRPF